MKVFRKVVVSLLLVLTAMVSSIWLFACGKSADGEPLAIVADENAAGKTLIEVMSEKEDAGELSYQVKNGMVVAINGTENDIDFDPCWMLYTSDEENSDTTWGAYEYAGEVLGSASVGAEDLIVKSGEIYVWVYQTF